MNPMIGDIFFRAYKGFLEFKKKKTIAVRGCCNICPRDSCPRRPWSKGINVQGTVFQGDFGPRRLLSKEAFTSDKFAQIIFFYSLLDITILIDYKITEK